MFYSNGRPCYGTTIQIALAICLSFIHTFFLLTPQVSAQDACLLSNGPRITKIEAGFGGAYRDGNWVPLQVNLENNGPEFDGRIAVALPSSFNNPGLVASSTTTYEQAISLPSLSEKQITIDIPVTSGIQGYAQSFAVNLINTNGQKVTSQSTTLQSIKNGTLFIGLITASASPDSKFLTTSLNDLHVPIQLQIIKPDQLPDNDAVLNNFDMIVLDNFTGSSLAHNQGAALQDWVLQGGTLVTIGGPEGNSTLGQLPTGLLPVTLTGNDQLPSGTRLLPLSNEKSGEDQEDTPTDSVSVSVATPHPTAKILLSSGTIPLLVQATEGQGLVYYLAYDPFLSPLVQWVGIGRLWREIILRSLGNGLLSMDSGSTSGSALSWKARLYSNMDRVLSMLIPPFSLPIWIIFGLLLGYVVVLGPIRLLVVRWNKRRNWTPHIVLCTIVIFSLLSYGLALEEKNTSIVSSRISVIQLNRSDQTGSTEQITDYMGILVPSQTDLQVRVPALNLIQPIGFTDNYLFGSNGSRSLSEKRKTIITSFPNETDINLQGESSWIQHSLVSQYHTHINGGLASHLILDNQQNRVTGTVTNTLPYPLNDAYLLIGEDFAPLGTLASGQTKPVTLVLNFSSNMDTPSLLADRIAQYNGVSTSLSPTNSSLSDALHRHMSIFESFSNDCGTRPCLGNFNSYGIQTAMQDPLQLPGVPATLIGWTSSQAIGTNAVTLGGTTLPQVQEALIQAPLPITFSGAVDIPASLTSSQITDIQVVNGNMQQDSSPRPGIYCMTTGSMTFELTLPTLSQPQSSSLNFTEPQYLDRGMASCASGMASDVTYLNVSLYNWQTGAWDEKAFNSYEFTVDDAQAYIGSGGRILIQFANQDSSLGSIVFASPAVELHGTVR